MACRSCNKNKNNIPLPPPMTPEQLLNADTTNPLTFIKSLGWNYIGDCNCRGKMMKFNNPKYIGFTIWIPSPPKKPHLLQIRQASNQHRGDHILGAAGMNEYIELYNKHF